MSSQDDLDDEASSVYTPSSSTGAGKTDMDNHEQSD